MTTAAEQIRLRPDLHVHENENELLNCCMKRGKIDVSLMEAHGQFVDLGTNGGRRCDVLAGPCACGAWHDTNEAKAAEIKVRNALRSLFIAILPKLTHAQNQKVSEICTEAIREWILANPKDRKRVLEKYEKKIASWAKSQKNKTA